MKMKKTIGRRLDYGKGGGNMHPDIIKTMVGYEYKNKGFLTHTQAVVYKKRCTVGGAK